RRGGGAVARDGPRSRRLEAEVRRRDVAALVPRRPRPDGARVTEPSTGSTEPGRRPGAAGWPSEIGGETAEVLGHDRPLLRRDAPRPVPRLRPAPGHIARAPRPAVRRLVGLRLRGRPAGSERPRRL